MEALFAQKVRTVEIGIAKHIVLLLGLIRTHKTVNRGWRAHHGVQQEDEEQHGGSRHEADGLCYRHGGGGGVSDSRVIAGVVRSAHDSQTAEGDEEQ